MNPYLQTFELEIIKTNGRLPVYFCLTFHQSAKILCRLHFTQLGGSQEFLLFLQEELWLGFIKIPKIISRAFVLRVKIGNGVLHLQVPNLRPQGISFLLDNKHCWSQMQMHSISSNIFAQICLESLFRRLISGLNFHLFSNPALTACKAVLEN